jgi:hypothetical protein
MATKIIGQASAQDLKRFYGNIDYFEYFSKYEALDEEEGGGEGNDEGEASVG